MKLPRRTRAEIDPRDEAIGWLAREDEGRLTPDQRAQLRAWLDADPARADLYARASEAVGAPNRYSAHPQMMEMRSAALAALCQRPRRPRHHGRGHAVLCVH